jgi:hypothetical protein
VYYQSVLASNLGGKISITNACLPSTTHICIYYDDENGKYAVNYGTPPLGNGLESQGEVTVIAGMPSTWQVISTLLTLSLTHPYRYCLN